ncbi:RNA ligase family protein [Brumicola nitratireducens]|uniref:RnlB RNA ligase 2 n=1 Tax=Glaciecola nitratireducens (strain JCM 12485 / KCTC 12276 / FR1064) TaxID=1085623 RepID=G4QGX6_GLANF|nr:RNA ligase family protein [Glaciecola nitratireducens]AEP29921.1 RnlB RNA ligase 2 [Glaciecola nitratireducens FR1064]
MFQPFPKIGQFRNVVKDIRDIAESSTITHLSFIGTVKLHGTNAAISYSVQKDKVYYQSRSRLIQPLNDNAGFATWAESIETDWHYFLQDIADGKDVIVYGEWCGGNIQRGVALTNMPKMFVMFAAEIEGKHIPLSSLHLSSDSHGLLERADVFFIDDFPVYEETVDLQMPENSINRLTELTLAVEDQCPVAHALGVTGVGEGIVWRCTHPSHTDLLFKVKGEKHSVSKVKTLAAVDPEKLNSMREFVEYAVTENRLNQGVEVLGLDQKNVGNFIGWVSKDVWTEEQDVLEANNLTMRDVGKFIANKARHFYLTKLNNEVFA